MPRTIALLALLVTCLLPGCRTYSRQYYLGSEEYELAARDLGEGKRETYRLQVGGRGSLRVETGSERERPFLGFQLTEIDKARAEKRGVLPYSGLQVTGCYPQSAAEHGGVLAGDILLQIEDQKLVYLSQAAVAEGKLRVGQVAHVKLLRGQSEMDIELETKVLREHVVDSQDIPLDTVTANPRPFAGVSLLGIPATWCERIFGEVRNAVVVSDVEVGSPAWIAGVRGGDVIDSVDGSPVPTVNMLSQRIAELGVDGKAMQWHVRRGAGQFHDATIQLSDYSGESNAWVPLVFYYQNGTYQDRWSIGPLGLVMSNRNTYLTNTHVRRPETRNVFSAVLGLFRVETTPDETDVRLLWIIHFKS